MNTRIRRKMVQLGLADEDPRGLFIVPAAIVAWADGLSDMKEIEEIAARSGSRACAKVQSCVSGDVRGVVYRNFVYQKPVPDALRLVMDILRETLAVLPANEASELRTFVAVTCDAVARVSGTGLTGWFNKVAEAEKQAARDIAIDLGLHKSPEAKDLLAGLGI